MKIGRRIKKVFGYVNEVDFVRFIETQDHIVALIASYDVKITHKQVNAVLNNYDLGHWTFIESRTEPVQVAYKFRNSGRVSGFNTMISVYRIDKKKAMKALEKKETELLEKKV